MKGLPEQWTHPHTEFGILAAHPLEASYSCISTNSFSMQVQHISISCIKFAGSAFEWNMCCQKLVAAGTYWWMYGFKHACVVYNGLASWQWSPRLLCESSL